MINRLRRWWAAKYRYKQPLVITMGIGEVATGHSSIEGMPCLIFKPLRKPGVLNEGSLGVLSPDRLDPGSVCLRFADMYAVAVHLERIERMVEDFKAYQAGAK